MTVSLKLVLIGFNSRVVALIFARNEYFTVVRVIVVRSEDAAVVSRIHGGVGLSPSSSINSFFFSG